MTYITVQGDTFDKVAVKTLGDESQTGEIISLNPRYANKVLFSAGVGLKIPPIYVPSLVENLPPWIRNI
jgi:hypothetical protein